MPEALSSCRSIFTGRRPMMFQIVDGKLMPSALQALKEWGIKPGDEKGGERAGRICRLTTSGKEQKSARL